MKKSDYDKLLNKNTLSCWWIMAIILFVAYIVELLKGARELEYIIVFSCFLFIPLLILTFYYKKCNPADPRMKYQFTIAVLLFYTFALITANNCFVYVYIFPMISALLVYSDRKLTLLSFIYVIFLNIGIIITEYIKIEKYYMHVVSINEKITSWEIQLASLILSTIFMFLTSVLLKKRDDMLIELSNDVSSDALTGLYNIRFLEENMSKLFNMEGATNINVAFIDVDNFKKFNTLYGHKFGDKVLIELGKIFKDNTIDLKSTYAIRVGGDEFVIVSKSLTSKEFIKKLEAIRSIVEKNKLDYEGKKVGVNISIGCACKKTDKKHSFLELYNLADERNNIAKQRGKNIIISKSNE